jgi:hypothetical protein
MEKVTVSELREILNGVLERLEDREGDAAVSVVQNTYFLDHPRYFLSIAGVGYINLSEVELEGEDEEEEE